MPNKNIQFAHLFVDRKEHYLYIDNIGRGAQSQVQRCLHLKSGEVRARKVSLTRESTVSILYQMDAEARIVSLLDAYPRPVDLPPPSYVELFGFSDIPSKSSSLTERGQWHRVGYWRYANVGTANDIRWPWMSRNEPLPLALLARFLSQVLATLCFMYTRTYPIVHGDLGMRNILADWPEDSILPDFWVADFGLAVLKTKPVPASPAAVAVPQNTQPSAKASRDRMWDVTQLLQHIHSFLTQRRDIEQAEWMRALDSTGPLRPVIVELASLDANQRQGAYGDRFPDLRPVLKQAKEAEEYILREHRTALVGLRAVYRKQVVNPAAGLQPKLYPTKEALLEARCVYGPWHVAVVDVNTQPPAVLYIEEEAHSRPNLENSLSDTDPGSDVG